MKITKESLILGVQQGLGVLLVTLFMILLMSLESIVDLVYEVVVHMF